MEEIRPDYNAIYKALRKVQSKFNVSDTMHGVISSAADHGGSLDTIAMNFPTRKAMISRGYISEHGSREITTKAWEYMAEFSSAACWPESNTLYFSTKGREGSR